MTDVLSVPPLAKAEMLIRKPVSEVFEAFLSPAVGSKFWFTRSSGRLEVGKVVRWEWDSYEFSTEVTVLEVLVDRKIVVGWSFTHTPTRVEWTFTPLGEDATYVTIQSGGFGGEPDRIVLDAMRVMGGFHFVLAGLKALLEHGIELNLIADAFPRELRSPHH